MVYSADGSTQPVSILSSLYLRLCYGLYTFTFVFTCTLTFVRVSHVVYVFVLLYVIHCHRESPIFSESNIISL